MTPKTTDGICLTDAELEAQRKANLASGNDAELAAKEAEIERLREAGWSMYYELGRDGCTQSGSDARREWDRALKAEPGGEG